MKALDTVGPTAPGDLDLDRSAMTMAVALLARRLRELSEADRRDVFELFGLLRDAETPAEAEEVLATLAETLTNHPATARPMPLDDAPAPAALRRWMKTIGSRVREARRRAGLTQAQLAERSGIPQPHLSRLERGEHSPSAITRKKLAAGLGLPPDAFEIEGEMEKSTQRR
jgi:ribosome-binding protein aMBF1 (putative translation factor)